MRVGVDLVVSHRSLLHDGPHWFAATDGESDARGVGSFLPLAAFEALPTRVTLGAKVTFGSHGSLYPTLTLLPLATPVALRSVLSWHTLQTCNTQSSSQPH